MASIDQIMKTQIGGLTWLDSVDYYLDIYEKEQKQEDLIGPFQKW